MLTVTGDKHVIDWAHLAVMKDGCVLANAGHFNVEINLPALEELSREKRRPREHVEEFVLADGRRIRLLAEGRLVNLAAAEGHPSAVMDMSFANQVLGVLHLTRHHAELMPGVHPVPAELDQRVARLKLAAMNIAIDTLTSGQQAYLTSWEEGT
jgi:adenosylhomocysteinase